MVAQTVGGGKSGKGSVWPLAAASTCAAGPTMHGDCSRGGGKACGWIGILGTPTPYNAWAAELVNSAPSDNPCLTEGAIGLAAAIGPPPLPDALDSVVSRMPGGIPDSEDVPIPALQIGAGAS